MNPNRIKLGMTAKDISTGVVGMVIQRVDQLSGNVQFVLQPPGDGMEATDAIQVDHVILDIVDKENVHRVVDVVDPTTIKVGQKVRDIVSLHEGIVTSKCTFMNGCEFFNVAGPKREQDKDSLVYFINVKQVELVDHGVLDKFTPAKKTRATGGPSSKVARPAVQRG